MDLSIIDDYNGFSEFQIILLKELNKINNRLDLIETRLDQLNKKLENFNSDPAFQYRILYNKIRKGNIVPFSSMLSHNLSDIVHDKVQHSDI